MPKTVLYHLPDNQPAVTLFVLKENKDGTLDLSVEDGGELKVGKCPLVDEPKVGHCTLASPAEGGDDLASKSKKELLDVITELNADPEREQKIEITGKENKAELLELIKAAALPQS